MADYTHTIDRWDEATGENLIVQICQHRRLLARARAGGVRRWPKDKITLRNRTRTQRGPPVRPSTASVWGCIGENWIGGGRGTWGIGAICEGGVLLGPRAEQPCTLTGS